jgi:hypothetical protein
MDSQWPPRFFTQYENYVYKQVNILRKCLFIRSILSSAKAAPQKFAWLPFCFLVTKSKKNREVGQGGERYCNLVA